MIKLWFYIVYYIIVFSESESKPLKQPYVLLNKIDHGSQSDYKTFQSDEESFTPLAPVTNNAKGRASDQVETIQSDINNSTEGPSNLSTSPPRPTINNNNNNNNNDNNNNNIPNNNLFTSLLIPWLQKIQFSPQAFFQDRLGALKDLLTNIGVLLPNTQITTAKQFTSFNKLLNFIGLEDNGFYTDRLEPGGLFDGNGWLSNKGGLLGGPGAIVSTGPILTDYPTPYRKKK